MNEEGGSSKTSPSKPNWVAIATQMSGWLGSLGVDIGWWAGKDVWPSALLLLMKLKREGVTDQAIITSLEDADTELISQFLILWKDIPDPLSEIVSRLTSGDLAEESGDSDRSVLCYRQAADMALSPAVQLEIGGLLLYRAGVDPKPLMEADFEGVQYPWDQSSLEEARCWLGRGLLPGPRSKASKELLSLALDIFGRTAIFILQQAGASESERVLSDLDNFRMYLALDGLRVILTNLSVDHAHLRQLCEVYLLWWQEKEGWYFFQDERDPGFQDNPFTPRFEYTRGYVDGMAAKSAIDTASALTDTPLLLREIKRGIEGIKRERTPTRAESADALARHLGDIWAALNDSVKDELIEAENLFSFFLIKDRPDFGAAIVAFAKALEGLCASLERVEPGVSVLGRFGDTTDSPLQRKLRPGAPLGQIIESVRIISRARNRWAHFGDRGRNRIIPLSEAKSLRTLALDTIRDIAHWRRE